MPALELLLCPLCLNESSVMIYFQTYLLGLAGILSMMLLLWIVSIRIINVSIVDIFWGMGFIVACLIYFIRSDGYETRKILVLCMVCIWGLRLSIHLFLRNRGKGEDFRYKEFRRKYGAHRYWWISLFQTFLLQGILMWLVSAPLLGAQYLPVHDGLNAIDFSGLILWLTGLIFEAGGDFQLARFKKDPANKGKVMDKGFWRYTRHPNYFGDIAVWCGFAFMCVAAGSYIPVLGTVLMTILIIKVSGVALLERTLMESKPEYKRYAEKTSAFLPWFPKE